jgi:hypothetical protein
MVIYVPWLLQSIFLGFIQGSLTNVIKSKNSATVFMPNPKESIDTAIFPNLKKSIGPHALMFVVKS